LKNTLKTFPKGTGKQDIVYIADMVIWKMAFEAELQDILGALATYDKGRYYRLLKDILGEE